MIPSAIILAGGFGKRLQPVVKDLPKPMADIGGKPFLAYLLQYLSKQGIKDVTLSVGYKWESIRDYFGDRFGNLTLRYSVEEEPLGTGGAILHSLSVAGEECFIFNGDTFFNVDLHRFYSSHMQSGSLLSIAMKSMKQFDRYGVVETDGQNRILSFREKKFYEEGNINGGVYVVKKNLFDQVSFSGKFSFEKDLMEKYCSQLNFSGFAFTDYFIDIGIPEDYARAGRELPGLLAFKQPLSVDKSWTLFLDRDGVINKKIDGDYVRDLLQFQWLEGVREALVKSSRMFGRIIIVTNQQGVGKKLMTMQDVETIHNHIIKSIHDLGGRIDSIYFAPNLKEENSSMRKPGIGMALQARKDFPDIDFSKSVMVGDSAGDMEFGRKAGMKTVFISPGMAAAKSNLADFSTDSLATFTAEIIC